MGGRGGGRGAWESEQGTDVDAQGLRGAGGMAPKGWNGLAADAGGSRARAVSELTGRPAHVAAPGIKVRGPRIQNSLTPGRPHCSSPVRPRHRADGRGLSKP